MPKPTEAASAPKTKRASKSATATAKPTKSKPKSAEVVVDSEEEDAAQDVRIVSLSVKPVPSKTKAKAPRKPATKEKGANGKASAPPASQDVGVDSSSSEEDEDDSDNEAEKGQTTVSGATKSANAASVPAGDTSSEDDSSEGSDAEEEDQDDAGGVKSATAPQPNGTATTSEASSDSDEEMPDVVAQAPQPQHRAQEAHTSGPRPAKTFNPPGDFKAVTMDAASSTTKQIETSLRAGHQIWHITAPRGVPLSSLKDLAMRKIENGATVLSHQNIEFAFNSTPSIAKGAKELLLPSSDGYKPTSTPISRTLHLQQVIKLPLLSDKQSDPLRGSDAAAPPSAPMLKRKREQPTGLRQRFLPIGVNALDVDPSSDAGEQAETPQPQTGFRAPPSLSNGDAAASQKSRKRKGDETPEERAARKAAKKAKKVAKAGGSAAADGEDVKRKRNKLPAAAG